MAYSSIYRAKSISVDGLVVKAYVPQVFGDIAIVITDFLGDPPADTGMGWVLFQAGNPEFPVWVGTGVSGGGGGGGGGGADEVWVGPDDPGGSIELWYDTDAPGDGGGGGTNEVWIGPTDPIVANPTIELWYDSDAVSPDTGGNEVFVGSSAPVGFELWVDTSTTPPLLKAYVNGAWVAVSGGGGGTGVGSFVFNQGTPSTTWVIDHNLNAYPNVTVEDSAGSTIEGEIVYNTTNRVTLTFTAAFSGVAYLS